MIEEQAQNDSRAAFRLQAQTCRRLGSPFVAHICDLFANRLAPDGPVARALFDWQGNLTGSADAVVLRLMAALHALVLDGKSEALKAVYPPNHENEDERELWQALSSSLADHTEFILEYLQHPPQTNEVSRSAILLPGFLTVASQSGLPIRLSEIGASAGLNLFVDRYHYRLGSLEWGDPTSAVRLTPTWMGKNPPAAAFEIRSREGCDLRPLRTRLHADRLRVLSYIWADQTERISRTVAALDIAAKQPTCIKRADAVDWLENRLAQTYEGTVHIVFHTIAWQYLSAAAKSRCQTMLLNAGEKASEKAPIAWLRFEVDRVEASPKLLLTLWPGGHEHRIAKADFHGFEIEWIGWPHS